MSESAAPVVIAGAGPVGCVLALSLSRAGIPVHLLEAEAALPEDLRASTLHPATLDQLADLGVVDELIAMGLIARGYQYRDRATGQFAQFDLAAIADDTKFPFRLQCEQFKITRHLCALLERLPSARMSFGSRLVAARQSDDGVTAVVESDGVTREIRGSFLVGTDGARSVVRKEMGVSFDGYTYPEKFLVVSTEADLAELIPGLCDVNYVADAEEWCSILKTRDLWRVLFPAEASADDSALLADAAIEHRLQRLAPRATPYKIAHRTLYRVHQRVASQFRKGRLLLAGDAAHVNNPLGGMGMNGGIQDAFALARALRETLDDPERERALDVYAQVRRTIAEEIINEQTARNKKQMEERDPAQRATRIAELRALAAEPAKAREYLRRAAMLTAVDRARELEAALA